MSGGFGGIVFSTGNADPLAGLTVSSQTAPAKFYVYGHFDFAGNLFYIGKGIKRRAWDTEDRHSLWRRYVTLNLKNEYDVRILADGLSEAEAVTLESEIMMQNGETLVNWVNWGRMDDFEAIERFHQLRDSNRRRITAAKQLEKTDLSKACTQYMKAIRETAAYASIQFEKGLVGRLRREEREEVGKNGEVEALERLVMCLLRLGEIAVAVDATNEYFETYRGDTNLKAAERIRQRLAKASNE